MVDIEQVGNVNAFSTGMCISIGRFCAMAKGGGGGGWSKIPRHGFAMAGGGTRSMLKNMCAASEAGHGRGYISKLSCRKVARWNALDPILTTCYVVLYGLHISPCYPPCDIQADSVLGSILQPLVRKTTRLGGLLVRVRLQQ